jgi:cytosine deaminase
MAEGLNVAFGNDDMFDPWYPMGNGNMRDVVFLGLHVTQLMGYEDIMNGYRFVTTNAAKALHLQPEEYGIAEGNPASFVVLDAEHYYDALNNNAAVLYSYRNGTCLYRGTPGSGVLNP